MKKSIIFILIIAFLGCVVWFYHKPKQDDKLIKLREKYNAQLDSITRVYEDSLHRRELAALEAFAYAQRAADRWEGESKHWKRKYNEEIRRNRTFTSDEFDSLISSIK